SMCGGLLAVLTGHKLDVRPDPFPGFWESRVVHAPAPRIAGTPGACPMVCLSLGPTWTPTRAQRASSARATPFPWALRPRPAEAHGIVTLSPRAGMATSG